MNPTTPGPEQPDTRLSAFSLWLSVRKNWLLALAILLAVTSGTAFYTLGQTKIYEATATIMFDPNVPRPLGDKAGAGVVGEMSSYWNNKEYYKTQFWIIQSMRVASRVVRELGLNKDSSFLDNTKGKSNSGVTASVEDAALILTKRIGVEPVKDSRLTSVTYRDADPARAQRILSVLVDTYAQENLEDVFESATLAADWLRGQIGALREGLESSELALHQFKKDRNVLSVSTDDQSSMLRGEMTQLNQALTEVRTRRERVLSRLAELRKIEPDDPVNLPAKELIDSPTLGSLRAQYVNERRALESLLGEGRGNSHPAVSAAQARVDTMRTALLAEVRNIQEAYSRDVASLNRELGGLKGLYDSAEKRALELNLMEIEYGRLRRAKDTNEKLFSLVIERSKETDLTQMLRINNIRVVDRPLLPKQPVTPNLPLNMAGGLAAGLVLGLVAAIGREQFDRTLKGPDEVEREVGASLLGVLPHAPEGMATENARTKRRRGRGASLPPPENMPELTVHYRPTCGLAEAARAVRTNIIFMSPDSPHRTLLITSAAPSEGKTTVACAIATAIAQAGQRVVLVDCDLRRPRLHSVFRRLNDLGMTTALLDRSQEESIVRETVVPNLWLATTGPIPPNPAELLHSEAFRSILQGLSERFDRVIIDSPPIIPVTDATVLSTLVDGVVVVVRASKTTKDLVRRAVKSLRDVGGQVVGVVLNAADLKGRQYAGYQYYYYQREGYAATHPPSPQPGDQHVGHG